MVFDIQTVMSTRFEYTSVHTGYILTMIRSCGFTKKRRKSMTVQIKASTMQTGCRGNNIWWTVTASGGSEGVPASWPLCWHGSETFCANYSLACSFLDGKGPSSLYNPHCTCPEEYIIQDSIPHKIKLNRKCTATCLLAQTTEQNLLEPLKV